VCFLWSDLRVGDHGGKSVSPLSAAASDVHGSLTALPDAAIAALPLARAFSAISLKKKRTPHPPVGKTQHLNKTATTRPRQKGLITS
jgi:hypothetical protein